MVYRDPTGCLTAFYFSPFEVRDDSNPSGDGLSHLNRIKLGGAATVNAVEEEEEPSEVQGESGVASRFIDEPGHVDGAHVLPADELSDAESSVNQPVPAAQ